MRTHNICFYGELIKIILQLSSNTHLICSIEQIEQQTYDMRAIQYDEEYKTSTLSSP